MVSIWRLGVSLPRLAARQAEAAEAEGWDGLLLTDSQNLAGDVYAGLTEAALATSRLGLGTGVTNPVTRHPAATAGAIATVQAVSGGRAVLGIGRGDSSLAHLGLAPARPRAFERYLVAVRRYLRGEEVPFTEARAFGPSDGSPSIDELPLAAAPTASRLRWLRGDLPPVPVDVAATGPTVLGVAGRVADRVTLAVGADPDRVRWAVERVRDAASTRADGVVPAIGAFVNVVVHPDAEAARQLASGGLATFARFSVMHGTPSGPVSAEQDEVLRNVSDSYDMTRHTQAGTPQAETLTAGFADRFAVLGSADHCTARLKDLVALGLDRLVVIGGSAGADRDEVAQANQRFTQEVLPALNT